MLRMTTDQPTPPLSATARLAVEMATATLGTATGVAVMSWPAAFAVHSDTLGGRLFALALGISVAGIMCSPLDLLAGFIGLRLADRRAERSLPITEALAREIAGLVNAGRLREANRLTRRAVDPRTAAFEALRYVDLDDDE